MLGIKEVGVGCMGGLVRLFRVLGMWSQGVIKGCLFTFIVDE